MARNTSAKKEGKASGWRAEGVDAGDDKAQADAWKTQLTSEERKCYVHAWVQFRPSKEWLEEDDHALDIWLLRTNKERETGERSKKAKKKQAENEELNLGMNEAQGAGRPARKGRGPGQVQDGWETRPGRGT